MVGLAKSNLSLYKTVAYNRKPGSNFFYSKNMDGEDIWDYRAQMSDLQKCYRGGGKSLTLHVQLSPSIEDGKVLTEDSWEKMADMYLEKMGLQGHQALGFIHKDRGHRHLHLVVNRVSKKGSILFDDSFVGKRSSKAADEIAIEMKLERAKVIGIQKRKEKEAAEKQARPEKTVGSKQKFKVNLERILAQGHQDITSYLKAVEEDGYKVSIYLDKETGNPRGYGVGRDGAFMDASEIDRKLTISKLSFSGDKEVLEKAKRPEHNITEQQKQGRRR